MTCVFLAMGFLFPSPSQRAEGWTLITGPGNVPAQQFSKGESSRHDAVKARSHFARAADGFDSRWEAPEKRSITLALNRGRAHFLAGQLPQAIRAFLDGLALAPYDVRLQQGLLTCRAQVAYPVEDEPSARVRPDPSASLRHRVSPTDLLAVAGVASLFVTIGLARRFTSRGGWSDVLLGVGAVAIVLVAVAAWRIHADERAEAERPVVVIAADVPLRTGNGTAYPTRIDALLPRGAEVRELGRRGGWVQVELPGGAVGWVPATAVLPPS